MASQGARDSWNLGLDCVRQPGTRETHCCHPKSSAEKPDSIPPDPLWLPSPGTGRSQQDTAGTKQDPQPWPVPLELPTGPCNQRKQQGQSRRPGARASRRAAHPLVPHSPSPAGHPCSALCSAHSRLTLALLGDSWGGSSLPLLLYLGNGSLRKTKSARLQGRPSLGAKGYSSGPRLLLEGLWNWTPGDDYKHYPNPQGTGACVTGQVRSSRGLVPVRLLLFLRAEKDPFRQGSGDEGGGIRVPLIFTHSTDARRAHCATVLSFFTLQPSRALTFLALGWTFVLLCFVFK